MSNEVIQQFPEADPNAHLSDRFFTVPTVAMTIPRAIAGPVIAARAIRGEKTAALLMSAAATDREGDLARWLDRTVPELEIGSSKSGADLDYKADFSMGLGALTASAFGKNSHPISRLSAAVGFAKQVSQAKWAVSSGLEYKEATGQTLRTKVGKSGRLATGFLFGAVTLDAVSRDIEPSTLKRRELRTRLACASLLMSASSVVFGKMAEKHNTNQMRQKIAAFEANR